MPGTYRIDPAGSAVTFRTRHLFGVGAVRGRFQVRHGEIRIMNPARASAASAVISAASFHTGNPQRDATVQSARLLDAAAHPDITFTSTRLEEAGGRWLLHGQLTVRGSTRPVSVRVDEARSDGSSLSARASLRVDRYRFGITRARGLAARYLDCRLDITASQA